MNVRYTMKNNKKRILCLGCASFVNKVSGNIAYCHKCGKSIKLTDYKQLFQKVSDSVRYGYIYRKSYEEQLNKYGDIRIVYCLNGHPEALNWIALAIFSGIIGGASWDTVKFVINKIKKQLASKELQEINFLTNNSSRDEFSLYLKEYNDNYLSTDANGLVIFHIVKEKFIDDTCKLKIKSKSKLTASLLIKTFKSNYLKTISKGPSGKSRISLTKKELSNIWKNIDLSG